MAVTQHAVSLCQRSMWRFGFQNICAGPRVLALQALDDGVTIKQVCRRLSQLDRDLHPRHALGQGDLVLEALDAALNAAGVRDMPRSAAASVAAEGGAAMVTDALLTHALGRSSVALFCCREKLPQLQIGGQAGLSCARDSGDAPCFIRPTGVRSVSQRTRGRRGGGVEKTTAAAAFPTELYCALSLLRSLGF